MGESGVNRVPTNAGVGPSSSWMPSMAGFRSPLIGFNEMFNSFIPQGHEKGLKFAFYNTIALIFLCFVLSIMIAVYYILEPFLRPLLWALLCGSALHPFKQKLLFHLEKWIQTLRLESRPITFGAIYLPLSVINYILDIIIAFFVNYWKLLFVTALSIGLHNYSLSSLENINNYFCTYFFVLISIIYKFVSIATNTDYTSLIMTSTVGYLIAISHCSENWLFRSLVTPLVWIILFLHIIELTGTFGYILSTILISIIIIGILKTSFGVQSHDSSVDQIDGLAKFSLKIKSIIFSVGVYLISILKSDVSDADISVDQTDSTVAEDSSQHSKEYASVATSPIPLNTIGLVAKRRESVNSNNIDFKNLSNTYLYALLWAFILVQIWFHVKLLYLATIPILLVLLRIGWFYVSSFIYKNKFLFSKIIEMQNQVLFHPFIRQGYNYFLVGDKAIIDTIESSLNAITSLTVICVTLISILFAAIFMAIQIYGESLYLVNLMSNVFNKTIGDNPELTQLLPESFQGVHGMLDQVVRNGYEYGREYIKNTISDALNVDGNVTQTKVVEKQILEIWDRAYHLWLIRNVNDTDSFPKKGPYDFDKLLNALKTLDFTLCFNIVKENIDTLISVFDSVWLLLKGNITLLFTAIAAIFSSLLGGGTALMNMFLSFIIFTTALFYLLSASGEYYKPVELVNRIFPSDVTSQENTNSTNRRFGKAVEEAINGVFAASLKISAFYGLYTWLIHTLFDVNIVYIPSVMAATFGAVPFLGAYWASFPAILELWLVQGEGIKAILMITTALLPACFIDSTIYSEIKSAGHPYLTGLAIAGGVFYLGFEGAVIGPILLCCLFVVFNIYSSLMQSSASVTPDQHSGITPDSNVRHRGPNFRRLQSSIE